MAYERQKFKNGQVLKAEHLACIEDCLCDMSPVADSFKFSSDCIGKAIRVLAIDDAGRPTKWETVDPSEEAEAILARAKESGEFDGPQGPTGPSGSDASVTAANIKSALGYTPADQEKVEKLSNAIVGLTGAPDYLIKEVERVANAVQSVRTARTLVFPVLSDMHIFDGNSNHAASLTSAQYAGMGIGGLKKRLHFDFVGYLGDYTWGAADHTVKQVKQDITAFKETTDTNDEEIWCVGNHDLNYGKNRDRLMTTDEVYAYIGANSDGVKPYADIERGYGYLDFEQQKIRVIYLNTCDVSDWVVTDGVAARSEWVSPAQIQWLADTALNFASKDTPSEWGIVIIGHHPLHYGFSCFDSVMLLLEAYRDGLRGSLSCTIRAETVNGSTTYPQQTVSYDFSAEERAEIICNIHGHNHNCGYSKISSSTRTGSALVAPWLWRFCIPNICANRYNTGAELGELYGEYDESGNAITWTKETGTAKATSFCVVSIDRANELIYAHIFGAGVDRVMSYGEVEPVTYTITRNLTNCTSSGSAVSVVEGSAHSETLTAASRYTMDGATVTVTMGGVDITSTAYSGGVLTIGSVTGDIVITATAEAVPVAPSYTNQIPISTDASGNIFDGDGFIENQKLSSSGGATTSATGYATTGFIPIGVGTANSARGEQVVRFSGVPTGNTDGDTRIAFYDASYGYIQIAKSTAWKTPDTDDGNAALVVALGDDGYIESLDVSGYTHYLHKNMSKTPAFFRFCAPGIDGDSIITVNEPIE